MWPHRQGGCLACCGYTFESRWDCTGLYNARGAQLVLPMRGGGCDQSIGSTVSDAIVCSSQHFSHITSVTSLRSQHFMEESITHIALLIYTSGRGARVSACAGLINQLQCCQFDSRIACLENPDRNCRRLVDGGGGTPRPVLLTGAKNVPSGVHDYLRATYGLSKFRCH